jgi:hypothetical protein
LPDGEPLVLEFVDEKAKSKKVNAHVLLERSCQRAVIVVNAGTSFASRNQLPPFLL